MIKIEVIKSWTIVILIAVIAAILYFRTPCSQDAQILSNKAIKESIKVSESKTIADKKEVILIDSAVSEMKVKRKKITYKTSFTPQATADTVKVELVKADKAVKILDSTVALEDKAIAQRDTVIKDEAKTLILEHSNDALLEDNIKSQTKIIRRQKRKLFFTRVGTGLIVGGGVVLAVSNPITGAVLIIGGAGLVIVEFKK